MKLLLIGASGMVGSRVLAEAAARGHEITAGARNPQKIAKLPGVTPVQVEASDAAALTALAKGKDAILVSVSPRSTGDAVAEAAGFAKAAMAAAKASGVRLVVVGGAGSLNLPDGTPVLETLRGHLPEAVVQEATGFRAFRDALKASDLDWTFFSPSAMIAPGERTGKFRTGTDILIADAEGKSAISAEDYAIAFLDEVETAKHRRQTVTAGY